MASILHPVQFAHQLEAKTAREGHDDPRLQPRLLERVEPKNGSQCCNVVGDHERHVW